MCSFWSMHISPNVLSPRCVILEQLRHSRPKYQTYLVTLICEAQAYGLLFNVGFPRAYTIMRTDISCSPCHGYQTYRDTNAAQRMGSHVRTRLGAHISSNPCHRYQAYRDTNASRHLETKVSNLSGHALRGISRRPWFFTSSTFFSVSILAQYSVGLSLLHSIHTLGH